MADDGNLSPDKTEKIAMFQEITHTDSIEECRQILEAFSWNLESAIQNTFADHTPLPEIHQLNQQQQLPPNIFFTGAQIDDTDFLNRANNAPPTPPPPQQQQQQQNMPTIRRSLSRANNSQSMPSVNMHTQRTLSYYAPQQQAVVPQGFFQWSVFLVAFPFKLIITTLMDIFYFFCSLFESNSLPTDYDPFANVVEFASYYNQKYGLNHIDFFIGSYSQFNIKAVNEAKRDLKFLLVYIHQNDNKDCNLFATETLSNKDLVEYLKNSFVFWACSKNLPEGHKVFSALKAKRCPFLGVIVYKNARMTLVTRIEGPIEAGELMLQLSQIVAEHEPELVAERVEREQRAQTQLLRAQQDEAYEESLKVDREKARKKQEEEQAKKRAEELERAKIEDELEKERNIVNKKIELRRYFVETPEPEASNALAIKLLIKLPSGARHQRLFLKTDQLSLFYKFVFCNEECPKNFEIVTNFPRRVVECDEFTARTIQDFGINESMLLFVNDLDA